MRCSHGTQFEKVNLLAAARWSLAEKRWIGSAVSARSPTQRASALRPYPVKPSFYSVKKNCPASVHGVFSPLVLETWERMFGEQGW